MKQQTSWHIDRKVNLSHLVATGGVIIAVLSWGSTVETRFERSEIRHHNLVRDIQRLEENAAAHRAEIRDDLKRINAKLDDVLAKLPR